MQLALAATAALPLLLLAVVTARRERVWVWAWSGAVLPLAAVCWLVIGDQPATWWCAALSLIALWGAAIVVDLREQRLPDIATLGGYPLVLIALLPSAPGMWGAWMSAMLGGLACAGVLWVLGVTSYGRVSLGDVKLGLTTGAFAGWFGWWPVLLGFGAAFVIFALVALVMMLAKTTNRTQELPFGPAMALGAVLGPWVGSML